MEKLQHLIKSLNKSEKKMVRNFLTNYGNQGAKETLSLKLYELLNNRTKKISNKEASIILFGTDQKNRIRVLKNRTKSKVLDALTTEIVIANQPYDDSMKESVLLKKKMGQFFSIYNSKEGNMKLLVNLLDEIIEKGSKYELYPILIEALNAKKTFIGFRKGLDEYEKLEKIENTMLQIHAGLTQMVNKYYKLLFMYRTENSTKLERLKFMKESIQFGGQFLKEYSCKNFEHYLNIIEFAYYDEMGKFKKAREIMLKEVNLLMNHKSAYRKSRLGAAYDYLCQTDLRLELYEDAIIHAKSGATCFDLSSINYTVAKELEFRALLYNQKVKEALKIIKEIKTKYNDPTDKHRLSTHRYFLACAMFSNGQHKKCNQLLINPFEFKRDTLGWEFNTRVLAIMASLEQGKVKSAYEKYISLNRTIKRKKDEDKHLSSRNVFILRIIKEWIDGGGNKSLVKSKVETLFNKLNKSKNKWDPLGSELIDFGSWIHGLLKR